ncbi:hypothetical protein RI543_003197 [Arxiozyma heterogenica]|uniref:Uncharacterized protein n=1 Tax=Arxiozyma heterogenica TaxID=278026 RepID=A0AAN7WN07_9SACH|nr:hypothetical protein RI543_003197 [Kazachstania heterogenica]
MFKYRGFLYMFNALLPKPDKNFIKPWIYESLVAGNLNYMEYPITVLRLKPTWLPRGKGTNSVVE